MNEMTQEYLVVNMDKKVIMEPGRVTFSGGNSLSDMALTHPEVGNPFQYEFFHLLMDQWKGNRFTLFQDTEEVRDYFETEEGYTYYQDYRPTAPRVVQKEKGYTAVSFHPSETKRLKKNWRKFINQYVLINYDSQLFMTIDQRLYRRTKNLMPFFVLARFEENESNGSWAGQRVGIEPIGTPTLDDYEYVEMFRMIGDKSICQRGVEELERQFGQTD